MIESTIKTRDARKQDMSPAAWRPACRVSDLPSQGARIVRQPGQEDIAIFLAHDGEVFAVVDRCPHKGGPLSEGLVHGHAVTCPLHGWVIDLDSGRARAPDEGCARRVPVRIADGQVFLGLPESSEQEPVS